MYTRQQIRANRQKWIDFLLEKDRKKATGALDRGNGERCCLGHGCYALGIVRNIDGSYGRSREVTLAPNEFIEAVGLIEKHGDFDHFSYERCTSLTDLNDYSNLSPQQIGEILQGMIEGGIETPFISLTVYPED